jgi:membrane protease subunit HflK
MSQNIEQFPELNPAAIKSGVRLFALVALISVVAFSLKSMVYSVAPEGRAVIQRFGEVVSIEDPGLHFKLPLGIDIATFIPTERVLKEEFGFRTVDAGQRTQYAKTKSMTEVSLMLTGDLNVIDVEWVVQYRITDPVKFLFEVRDPVDTIRDVSEAVMRRIVGNRLGSEVLTVGRVEIADDCRVDIQKVLQGYDLGVSIERIELQDVTPPNPVKPAFNEVNEARQEKEKLVNEAEKQRNQIIPKARGEADQTIAEAEAYRAERVNQARGEASRFTSLLSAYKEAPDLTRKRLYLEMIDRVLPKIGQLYVLEESVNSPLPLLNLGAPMQNGGLK